MQKALSYILLGALGATAAMVCVKYKDDIRYKWQQIKKAGMDKLNQVKATTTE